MATEQERGIPVPAAGNKPARERFIEAVDAAGGARAVAARLGCTRSYVDMIKAGQRRPGIATAFRIQEVFGIAMEDWVAAHERRAGDAA